MVAIHMQYRTGALMVIFAGFLWSWQPLIIRNIDHAGSWTILTWRSLALAAILTGVLVARSGRNGLHKLKKLGVSSVIGAIGLFVAMGGSIFAFQNTTTANAAFILAASPFITAILARIVLNERVCSKTWIAIVLAIFGIFIMVRGDLGNGAMLGNLAAMSANLGFAAFSISLRFQKGDDSLPTVILGAGVSALGGALIAVFLDQTISVTGHDLLLCTLMGTLTMGIGMVLYSHGSKVVPSAELTLFSGAEVILSPLWVWLLIGESANIATLVGGTIVLFAILFNAYSGMSRAIPALG